MGPGGGGGGVLHNTYFILARPLHSSFVAVFFGSLKAAEWTQPDAARHCLSGLHDEAVRPLHVDPVALTVEWEGGWSARGKTACRERVGAQAASQDF